MSAPLKADGPAMRGRLFLACWIHAMRGWSSHARHAGSSRSTPCVDGPFPANHTKKTGPDSPPNAGPPLTHRAPVPAPVPIPVEGACSASHDGCYRVICKNPANFRADFTLARNRARRPPPNGAKIATPTPPLAAPVPRPPAPMTQPFHRYPVIFLSRCHTRTEAALSAARSGPRPLPSTHSTHTSSARRLVWDWR